MTLFRTRVALMIAGSLVVGATAALAAPLQLTSSAFVDGAMMTTRNGGDTGTCGGQNISPPLAWAGGPDGIKSFALMMFDGDAGKGPGVMHWLAYGIAPTTHAFAEGDGNKESALFVGGKNIRGTTLYAGPCPPPGETPHHYSITLYALDLPADALQKGLDHDAFLAGITGHVLGKTSLVPRYGR